MNFEKIKKRLEVLYSSLSSPKNSEKSIQVFLRNSPDKKGGKIRKKKH